MTKTKEDEWILHITRHFSAAAHYSTMCFVELLSILSSRGAQIVLIQDSPLWPWDEKNTSLLNVVIDKAKRLIESTPHESWDEEVDLSILNGVVSRLEAKRNKTEQS